MSKDPQYIANVAYNAAKEKRLIGNKVQIALEISRQLTELMLIPGDFFQFSDTLAVAQRGSPKNQNGHLVKRISEIINEITSNNERILQERQTEQTVDGYLRFYDSPEDLVRNIYVESEDRVKESGAKDKKIAITTEIVREILTMTEDATLADSWFHQIYRSMDQSDKRWYNDACGEIHKILFEEETDTYAHKNGKLKRCWNKITKPFKTTLSWLDQHNSGEGAFTLGGSIDYGKPKIKAVGEPSSAEKPLNSHFATHTEEKQIEANKLDSSSATMSFSHDKHDLSQAQNQHTKNVATSDNTVLRNVQDGLSLLGQAQKKAIGYNSIGRIARVIRAVKNVQDTGFWQGAWNTVVDESARVVTSRIPGANIVLPLSSLYDNNVPEGQACSRQEDNYQKLKKLNEGEEGGWMSQMQEHKAWDRLQECIAQDTTARLPNRLKEGTLKTIKFKNQEE